MKTIFRVENRFGCRDYDTLSEAKKNSTNDEYIKSPFGGVPFEFKNGKLNFHKSVKENF
jgi:hypothetical protein